MSEELQDFAKINIGKKHPENILNILPEPKFYVPNYWNTLTRDCEFLLLSSSTLLTWLVD